MSDTLLSVDVEGLQDAIDNANEINWSDLTAALSEGVTDFKSRMTTGPGEWHAGYRVRKKDGTGLSNYYVKPNHKRAEISARSRRGWKIRQRGISAVLFNDARDYRRNYYAQHVRRPGEAPAPAGELGPEATRAFEVFEEEMGKVAEKMIASLMGDLGGS